MNTIKKKNVFVCIVFILLFPLFLRAHQEESSVRGDYFIIKKIRDMNMQMFKWEWDYPDSDEYSEFLEWYLQRSINPSSRLRRATAFKFYKKYLKNSENFRNTFDEKNVTTWDNLNFFCVPNNRGNYVAEMLDRTHTEIGTVTLYHQLATPTSNIEQLRDRQEIIKAIIKNEELYNRLDSVLQKIKSSEGPILALWRGDEFKSRVKENHFFSMPGITFLNSSPSALFIKNISDHVIRVFWTATSALAALALGWHGLSRVIDTHLPDIDQRAEQWADEHRGAAGILYPYFWKIKSSNFLRAIIAVLGSYICVIKAKDSLKWMRDCFLVDKTIHSLVKKIAEYFEAVRVVYKYVKSDEELENFDEFRGLIHFFENDAKKFKDLEELLKLSQSNLLGKNAIMSHKGIVFKIFLLTCDLAAKIENLISGIGKVDVYFSCAKLYKEFKRKRVTFCFADFIRSDKPCIRAKRIWHPLIDYEKVVTNDVTAGIDGYRRNRIITGPNTGGKSCFLKASTIAIFTAQTLGMSPAESLAFTPFKHIETYLNITDDVNSGHSLFKAEVVRAQELIDKVQNAEEGEFIYTNFDEVFNGTSPREGAAAAYGVAKHLGKFENNICFIATHFPVMTDLEENTDSYSNYKVSVIKKVDGTIRNLYKVEPGISDQYIALDILQNEGFSGEILDEAQVIANL